MKTQLYKFYEGAIESLLPESFMNVAAVRYVPDHQEVFTDPEHDATFTMEIMQSPPASHTGSAAEYFFAALGKGNAAKECEVESSEEEDAPLSTPTSSSSSPSSASSPPPLKISRISSLVGLQRDVKRFGAGDEEEESETKQQARSPSSGDDLRIHIASIRLSPTFAELGEDTGGGVEIVVSLACPIRFGNPLNAKEFSVMEALESSEVFKRALESFKINDYSLFSPPAPPPSSSSLENGAGV